MRYLGLKRLLRNSCHDAYDDLKAIFYRIVYASWVVSHQNLFPKEIWNCYSSLLIIFPDPNKGMALVYFNVFYYWTLVITVPADVLTLPSYEHAQS